MELKITRDSIIVRWAFLADRILNKGRIPSIDNQLHNPWSNRKIEGATARINVCTLFWRSVLVTPIVLLTGGGLLTLTIVAGIMIWAEIWFFAALFATVAIIMAIASGIMFGYMYVSDKECVMAAVKSVVNIKKKYCPLITVS